MTSTLGIAIVFILLTAAPMLRADEFPTFNEIKTQALEKAQELWDDGQQKFQWWMHNEPDGQNFRPYYERGIEELAIVRDYALTPGTKALGCIWLKPSGPWTWAFTLLFSYWFWWTAFRVPYFILGRAFGWIAPEDSASWLEFALPWRWWHRRLWQPVAWFFRQMDSQANSSWASSLTVLCRVFRPGKGLPIGRFVWKNIKLWQTIAYDGVLHVNIWGPSGSGKSATINTMLGSLDRRQSALYSDCDAGITRAIGHWLMETGHKLTCIDPNNQAPEFPRGRWNLLREFDAAERRGGCGAVINAAKASGEGLVKIENNLQPTFDNGGKDFLVALELLVWLGFLPALGLTTRKKKDLVEVRHLLCCGLPDVAEEDEDAFDRLLFEMMALPDRYRDGQIDDGCGGKMIDLIARAGAGMRSGQSRTGENAFKGAAMRATSWLDTPLGALCEDAGEGDDETTFTAEDLITGSACVAIIAPLTDMKTIYSGFVRAITVMVAHGFQNHTRTSDLPPCVMIIDEANSLGRLELIEIGSPGFRKYGIQLVLAWQDIPAVSARTAYPDTWRSLISNAGMNLWMGAVDLTTTREISDMLGKHTQHERIEGAHWVLRLLNISKIKPRFQNVERLLLDPQQVKDLLSSSRGMMIVTGKDRPFIAAIDQHWKALPVTRYQPSHYGETLLRRFSRWVVNVPVKALDQRLSALGSKFTRELDTFMNKGHAFEQLGAAFVSSIAFLFAGAWFSTWQENQETVGRVVEFIFGILASIVCAGTATYVLGSTTTSAWRSASSLLDQRGWNCPYSRQEIRFGLGGLIMYCVLVCTGGGIMQYAQSFMPASVLLPALLAAVGAIIALYSFPAILVAASLIFPTFYAVLVGLFYASRKLAQAVGFERKLIWGGRLALLWLRVRQDRGVGQWLSLWLDHRAEKLAKRSSDARQPLDKDAQQ